jgi:mono/diheme cytochrome c family protein
MKPWSIRHVAKSIIIGLCGVFFLGCSENGSNAESSPASSPTILASDARPLPVELEEGEAKFNKFCSRCHGPQGQGTDFGPPLVHKIYEPNHHADMAFQRAAAQGVRAHHWKFGNMPKIDGVVPEDVSQIIAYIRWLQRQAGIF